MEDDEGKIVKEIDGDSERWRKIEREYSNLTLFKIRKDKGKKCGTLY